MHYEFSYDYLKNYLKGFLQPKVAYYIMPTQINKVKLMFKLSVIAYQLLFKLQSSHMSVHIC